MTSGESTADIPVVILAGGDLVDLQGRLQPKGCVLVAGRPMLAHIVDHYRRYGFQRFLVCSGTGHEQVVEIANNERKRLEGEGGAMNVVFTGESAGTSRRLREAFRLLPHDRTVAVSYVDIISDVDLAVVLGTHIAEAGVVTLTAVNLPTRFKPLGVNLFSARVRGLAIKPITEDTLVSGGYYFINQKQFAEVMRDSDKQESFEQETLPSLAASAALFYHKHDGYWQPIDSGRDVKMAEQYVGNHR